MKTFSNALEQLETNSNQVQPRQRKSNTFAILEVNLHGNILRNQKPNLKETTFKPKRRNRIL
jgi:hypothetical protein